MSVRERRVRWLLVLLPLIWLAATFAYLGDLGKHSDDYWCTLRAFDHDGLDWSRHPWFSYPYFFRPLYLVHAWFFNTVFWEHDWVTHLQLALLHAGVCAALHRLLVGCGPARGPALTAALLFGTCPLVGEVVCWSTASCVAIGALLMLMTLGMARRYGAAMPTAVDTPRTRGAQPPPAVRDTRTLAGISLLSFATACFYETAAAGLGAVPVVAWMMAPRAGPCWLRLRRATAAAWAAGVPCAGYVALMLATTPPGRRGAADALIGTPDSGAAAAEFMRQLRDWVAGPHGRDVVLGSIEHGLAVARDHPAMLALLAAIVAVGVLTIAQESRPCTPVGATTGALAHDGPRGRLALLGLLLMVLPWAPFVASSIRGVEMRFLYTPGLGAACLIAAVANALRRLTLRWAQAWRRAANAVGMAAVGALVLPGVVGLIGMQTQFRTTARLDARVTAQLAALAPYAEPRTAFWCAPPGIAARPPRARRTTAPSTPPSRPTGAPARSSGAPWAGETSA